MEQGPEYSEKYVEQYLSERHKDIYFPLYRAAIDFLPEDKDRMIVDLGCAVGWIGKLVLEKGYKNYVGIDFSSGMIEAAKLNVPQGTFVLGYLRDPKTQVLFRDYDIFVTLEVLEHIRDDLKLVESLPSGSLVIFSVPNFRSAAHVRWFDDVGAVIDRYDDLLDIEGFKVIRYGKKSKAFLFQSYRR